MRNSDPESLIRACESEDTQVQLASIEALVELQTDTAIPTLLDLLSSSNPVVRFTVIQALAQLGSEKTRLVGSELLKLIADPEEIVRSEVIDSLGILGYSPAVDLVKSALKHDSSALVRASAAETLGDLSEHSALSDLELSLRDPDESVRAYAANSFGLLAESSEVSKLTSYLESEFSMRVKAEILGAQYRLGKSDALVCLLGLLSSADDDLSTSILNILEDLLERKTPALLTKDLDILCQTLSELSQRLPRQKAHAQVILMKLQCNSSSL